MLLLMVEAEGRASGDLVPAHGRGAGDQLFHAGVDVVAVAVDLLHGRTREKATLQARKERPHGFVVGIEQIAVARMKGPVARQERREQEVLEEPGRVREMPFRGADVRHALDDVVLGRERRADRGRVRAHRGVGGVQCLAGNAGVQFGGKRHARVLRP